MNDSKRNILKLRRELPKGTVVELVHMEDPYPIKAGVRGTVEHIDDLGQIHVNWENGSTLALNPEIDEYRIIST